ncbi:MAG: prepilin-type N-terminal cleavage/methylation domain-containing protein [Betaproteobacteria bacterium]|nr:prepilin-type N-terminal cleavage/methylation domain-containing protein [Betaproteobacteria bacterium]
MSRSRSGGFTLLETVIAVTLLAMMLGLLFAGLRTGVRAWDAGTDRGDRADQLLLTYSFVRKELSAAFPWRFKDPLAVRLAFNGERERVRFVSMRPAELGGGGLAFVSFEKASAKGAERAGRLVMRRSPALSDAKDFEAIEASEPFTLAEGVTDLRFEYFGAENDTAKPAWTDSWDFPLRMPTHVRLVMKSGETALPEVVVALGIGEEAGCYETNFQRNCVPRR